MKKKLNTALKVKTEIDFFLGGISFPDGKDNNCDGMVDEGLQVTYYADLDGDGFGNVNDTIHSCNPPVGYVLDNTDCDDTNNAINPAATEIPDGVDNNCDGSVDPATSQGAPLWFQDLDNDLFGTANQASIKQIFAARGILK